MAWYKGVSNTQPVHLWHLGKVRRAFGLGTMLEKTLKLFFKAKKYILNWAKADPLCFMVVSEWHDRNSAPSLACPPLISHTIQLQLQLILQECCFIDDGWVFGVVFQLLRRRVISSLHVGHR